MAVAAFSMRGLADEPGRPAGAIFVLILCSIPTAISALGILGCWKIEKKVRTTRRR